MNISNIRRTLSAALSGLALVVIGQISDAAPDIKIETQMAAAGESAPPNRRTDAKSRKAHWLECKLPRMDFPALRREVNQAKQAIPPAVAATRAGMFGLAVVLASLYPGVTVLLARVVLGERLRWVQQAGLGLAAIGIILVAA